MTTRVIQPMFDPSQRIRPIRIARSRKCVSRQLFGPIDHEATRKFLESEFKKEQRFASDVWDFDFDKGEPKQTAGRRYEWKKVAITFAPRRPKIPQPEPDITELYATLPVRVPNQEDQESTSQIVEEKKDAPIEVQEKSKNKQKKITG